MESRAKSLHSCQEARCWARSWPASPEPEPEPEVDLKKPPALLGQQRQRPRHLLVHYLAHTTQGSHSMCDEQFF